MKRYLLFDSGCMRCTKIAEEVKEATQGWLEIRSLRDSKFHNLLTQADPGWQWQPTLLEVEDSNVRVFTGLAMGARLLSKLGPRLTINIIRQINHITTSNVGLDNERRSFLRLSGAILAGTALAGVSKPFSPKGTVISHDNTFREYTDTDYHFSLEYPSGWHVEAKVKQTHPYSVPPFSVTVHMPIAFGI